MKTHARRPTPVLLRGEKPVVPESRHLRSNTGFSPLPHAGEGGNGGRPCLLLKCSVRSRVRPAGSVMVVAMVCMAVAVALVATLLQGTLRARLQLRNEHHLRQAELLLDAGVERSLARRAADQDYDGETWTLPAGELCGDLSGRVVAAIDPDPDGPLLRVVAECRERDRLVARRSRELPLSGPSTAPPAAIKTPPAATETQPQAKKNQPAEPSPSESSPSGKQ